MRGRATSASTCHRYLSSTLEVSRGELDRISRRILERVAAVDTDGPTQTFVPGVESQAHQLHPFDGLAQVPALHLVQQDVELDTDRIEQVEDWSAYGRIVEAIGRANLLLRGREGFIQGAAQIYRLAHEKCVPALDPGDDFHRRIQHAHGLP